MMRIYAYWSILVMVSRRRKNTFFRGTRRSNIRAPRSSIIASEVAAHLGLEILRWKVG